MARITWTFGLVLSASMLAAWAFGGTEWGILNASRAPIARLHAEIEARTPNAAQTAGSAVTATAQVTPTPTPCGGNPKFVQSWILATGCYNSVSATSTTSYTITVPNDPDMLLMVETDSAGAGGLVVNGVTGNGAAMTLAASIALDGGEGTMNTYYLVNPAPGTYTVAFTITGGSACDWAATATLYQDVDTADPIGASVTGGNESGETSETDTITTTSGGSLIQDYVTNQNGAASATNGAPLWAANAAFTGNSNYAYGSDLQTSAAGVYNLNYSAASAEGWWEYEVVEIKANNSCATATPTNTATPTFTPTPYPTVCGGTPGYVGGAVLLGGQPGSTNPSDNYTYNVPSTVPDALVLVEVLEPSGGTSVSSMSFGGTTLTLESAQTVAGSAGMTGGTWGLYYMTSSSLAAGSTTLTVDYNDYSANSSMLIQMYVISDVSGTSPFGTIGTPGTVVGNNAPFTRALTPAGPNSMIMDFMASAGCLASGDISSSQSDTNLWGNNSDGTNTWTDYTLGGAPGTPVTMSYDWSSSCGETLDSWLVELEAPVACGTDTFTNTFTNTDTPTNTPTATLTPPPPTSTATATGTFTPTVTNTLTPIAATTQMLWQNGVLAPQWWGYTPSFAVWNGNVNGLTATAAVTDNISGEGTVLSFANTLANDSEIDCEISNGPGNLVNAGNYYASGHIQFDIMLGPAYVSPTTITVLYGGDFFNGSGWVNGCYSSAIPGLSQTSFTHVSIPFTTGYGSCVDTNAFYSLTFVASDSAITMPVGVQFYINDVQITPN